MIFNEKRTKNSKLRGLKMRGLRQNQIGGLIYTYANNGRNKVTNNVIFGMKKPAHMGAAHAISKIEKKIKLNSHGIRP